MKAINYLKVGLEHCNDSNTEDLRNYLQTLYEEERSCMYAECCAQSKD
jgi:hypothetical protein